MKTFRLVVLLSSLLVTAIAQASYDGKVIDAQTKAPIKDVIVTLDNRVVRTDAEGKFHLDGKGDIVKFRIPGYSKQEVPIADLKNDIALTPFKVKGLYLSAYGITSHVLRNAALETMKNNNMNALVIDVKDDRGMLLFNMDIPLAKEIGADKRVLVKDMPALMAELKKHNLYLIARIVTFKDDPLATAKPEWAVKRGGVIFHDRENLRWIDAFRKEAWEYNIAIAKAAAQAGFDEVQFDYVRFPDKKGIEFSQPNTMENRVQAISSFLETAHKELAPFNVMVAADIFGYVPWNENDTDIGQDINKITHAVDVVSLMLYPSGFQFGIPNYRNPVQHPYEIINLTLKEAQKRTNASPAKFRPWLQAFRDYAFDGGQFTEGRMHSQIKATNDFGGSGYMFWNPRNVYAKGSFDIVVANNEKDDGDE